MKKLFKLFLCLTMGISLNACGSSDNSSDVNNSDRGNNISTSENSNIISVEITTENWNDYFEIVQEEEFLKNSFGDVEGLNFVTYLKLKNQYEIEVGREYNSNLAIELKFVEVQYIVNIDDVNLTYEILDVNGSPLEKTEIFTKSIIENKVSIIGEGRHTEGCVSREENIEILRISGTIYIKKID